MSVKRAALLLSIAYVLLAAEELQWQLRAVFQIPWPPLGMTIFNGWWFLILSSILQLSWAAYFAFIYRERSQRKNPVSLWAITLWTAVMTTVAAVSSAVQVLIILAAHREAFATGRATWSRSNFWSQGIIYTTMALWIALIVLLAHDPKGQRTRRVAAVLAGLTLLTGCMSAYHLVQNEARSWNRTFALVWRDYPLTLLWRLAAAPAIRIFRDVCMVLFPFAVWKEIGPRVRHTDVAPERQGARGQADILGSSSRC